MASLFLWSETAENRASGDRPLLKDSIRVTRKARIFEIGEAPQLVDHCKADLDRARKPGRYVPTNRMDLLQAIDLAAIAERYTHIRDPEAVAEHRRRTDYPSHSERISRGAGAIDV